MNVQLACYISLARALFAQGQEDLVEDLGRLALDRLRLVGSVAAL